jgi:predicted metal-binding protein
LQDRQLRNGLNVRGTICFADCNPPCAVELKKFIAKAAFTDPGLTDNANHITLAVGTTIQKTRSALLALVRS